ncbi:MAG: acetate kinase [Armatimonadetes bacterium]|nr:acetate kinase [Armatimonadota bacterium]
MKILVLNSGSSSLKYQLIQSETEEVLARGIVERIGLPDGMLKHETASSEKKETPAEIPDHDVAMDLVFKALTDSQDGAISGVSEISAVGHRVVHGGEMFSEPTIVTNETLEEIDRVSHLAPLHNPPNIMGIRACMRLMPGVPQVAVFDTAFHSTIPRHAYMYALPYNLYADHGVRRYGFHGTSHRYVSRRAVKIMAERGVDTNVLKMITCHLGNGCSMAAVVGGRVVDTSMGFTPAEGLVMGTRSGDIDPAIPIFLERDLGMTPEQVDDLINKQSGLLGVSGKSSDMRDIEELAGSGDKRSALALEIFCYRVRKYIGSYAAAMGGLDAIVFTGGIGENSSVVRAKTTEGLEFLGVRLDPEENRTARGETDISRADAKVKVLVIPTNEERMIARETAEIMSRETVSRT